MRWTFRIAIFKCSQHRQNRPSISATPATWNYELILVQPHSDEGINFAIIAKAVAGCSAALIMVIVERLVFPTIVDSHFEISA